MTREEAIKILKAIRVYECYPKSASEETKEAIDMAIEALSAEAVTHGRLIDADALSEKLCETTIFIKDGEVFQRMVNDAPTVSAEAVQGWIPVTERLPEKDGQYLVTDPLFGDDPWVLTTWYGTPPMPSRPVKGKCFFVSDDEYGDVPYDDVVAWMPLPEPYKVESEDKTK